MLTSKVHTYGATSFVGERIRLLHLLTQLPRIHDPENMACRFSCESVALATNSQESLEDMFPS